ncbi:MAG: gephyrin-like molybdotransferase Glp [Spirochaetia bacterium]
MLQLEKAQAILDTARFPEVAGETVPLEEALGRVLAAELTADADSPPFDKAAMDGYAVASDDNSTQFTVLETIAAGDVPSKSPARGECSKIMTGAMMPGGTDKVIRVEYTQEHDGIMVLVRSEPYENVIKRGENMRPGDVVLSRRKLTPKDVGIIASLGLPSVEVAVRPKVGIITTGSEIVDPGEELRPGTIYNSNGRQLEAQIREAGGEPVQYGIIPDVPEALENAVVRGMEETDILLLSGGVSMGEYDYVPEILTAAGLEIGFHKLAIKPGRPTLYGVHSRTGKTGYVFGLPGNPVSTFVIFEFLVRGFLSRMMGIEYSPCTFPGTLGRDIRRKDAERTEFVPVRLEKNTAYPLRYGGSSHLNALGNSDGFLRIDSGIETIEKGEIVVIRLV